jgi:hypothetical protein
VIIPPPSALLIALLIIPTRPAPTVTRRALDLETHATTDMPVLEYSDDERIYDANFNRILEMYPIPEDYQVQSLDEKVEVSKKQKVTVRRL